MLSGSLVAEESADGWFPVEHHTSQPLDGDDADPSIWVLFSKQFEEEKVVVRLPDDPTYQYATGQFEVSSSKDEELFQLKAQEKGKISGRIEEILALPGAVMVGLDRKSELQIDLLYQLSGKWIQEHLVETPYHLFILQTVGPEPDSANHLHFIESLRIEK